MRRSSAAELPTELPPVARPVGGSNRERRKRSTKDRINPGVPKLSTGSNYRARPREPVIFGSILDYHRKSTAFRARKHPPSNGFHPDSLHHEFRSNGCLSIG